MKRLLRKAQNKLFPRPIFLNQRKDLRNYEIGAWSYGELAVYKFRRGGKISIGKFCSFAAGTVAMLGGDHNPRNISTYPFGVLMGGVDENAHASSKGDIIIGNDVWVGRNATIMAGVTVGDGAVIGAGAIVTRNVPPYAIVAGNPAEVLKYRFAPEQIEKLLQLRWWDWPDERIRSMAPELLSDNVAEFLNLADK